VRGAHYWCWHGLTGRQTADCASPACRH
jgi:hypothetical protein